MTKETVIEYNSIAFGYPGNNTCVALYNGDCRLYWGYWLWNTGAYYVNYNKNQAQLVFFDDTGLQQ